MELDLLSRLLFPRPPISYTADSFPGELLWVPRSLNPQTAQPEDCIPLCLLQSPSAKCLVVYFHSNFEDIGRCYAFCKAVSEELKAHVLIVEYPSYGICPGDQCDDVLAAECCRVALRFVREVLRCPRGSIILIGRSIGTGLATLLAAEHRYGGLVLICPFSSIKDLASGYVGPAAALITERFPNKENIARVKYPCLFVHGQSDGMIPVKQCQDLFNACLARKSFVSPTQMEHNANLLDSPSHFLEPMQRFLNELNLTDLQLNVPAWCFDKLMCPQYTGSHGQLAPSQLTCWTAQGSCQVCEGPCSGMCKSGCQSCVRRGGVVVEEKAAMPLVNSKPILEASIAKAIETTFLRPRGEVGVEPGAVKRSQELKPMQLGRPDPEVEEVIGV